ncbi:unnamed protein product [Chrysodeixis includens]|uniref:Uncharacterized protein n=1 Tax=Chrysodeixis includens TaxID=689277 RepID=A0A9P0C366_CHRIL|nr:unnamed protein product [Chrysodeixis includens]
MTSNLYITCFIMVILLHYVHNTSLSKYRNPNDYLSPADRSFLQQIPDDMFESLLVERPDMKEVLMPIRQSRLRHPVLEPAPIPPTFHDLYPDADEDDEKPPPEAELVPQPEPEHGHHNSTTQTTTRLLPFLVRNANPKPQRRGLDGPYKASCFICNRWDTEIPKAHPYCYTAFESDDWRHRTMARYYRARCYYNKQIGNEVSYFTWKGYTYRNQRGLKRWYYGPFDGACFKRFLDLGIVYTSRGCRAYWPYYQKNFLNHRFQRLELLLWKRPDGCLSSPAASLTPFSRGISLFTRFHVCICRGKYCNSASLTTPNTTAVFTLLLIYIYFI